jgi:DNA polymerase III epsilon subunit-like protein|uniref:Exonuclease domain-containing protein n=1 Tax=viral metagenome TaxID=1070528 RepID=A0A6C0IQD5_9ZZZZ
MEKSNRVLVFDTETTGLPPRGEDAGHIKNYPYITQLSYIVYDCEAKEIVYKFDSYINIDASIPLSEEVKKLTGVSREKLDNGVDMLSALKTFYKHYSTSSKIIAHNIGFDKQMMMVEMERHRESIQTDHPECLALFNTYFEKSKNIRTYCTMANGKDVCNITLPSKFEGGRPYKKNPKLIELYKHLFDNKEVEGLHNSMMDVLVCLQCYLKMVHDYVDTNLGV